MPLQATSGAASYDAFGGGVPFEPIYIEQVFQTWLYTGNGSTQTITNGIDLSGKGGMVWFKARDEAGNHCLIDTVRGKDNTLFSNTTDSDDFATNRITAFNANGFSLGTSVRTNKNAINYASWTFREQPKFFDVVTWTGTGSARTIPHNLGSAPGCIIVKSTNDTFDWIVWHRSFSSTNQNAFLNTTDAAGSYGVWSSTAPTSTEFSLTTSPYTNQNGTTYVAYLFAHNAGGFGLTGTDNVISCGSYAGSGAAQEINLGYEPQWVLIKNITTAGWDWYVIDNMRGFVVNPASPNFTKSLSPNTSGAESDQTAISPTATGFRLNSGAGAFNGSSNTYIYIAIRRGPMKVPTTGTSVYTGVTRTGTGATASISGLSFAPDAIWTANRTVDWSGVKSSYDRLRGAGVGLGLNQTSAETAVQTNSVTAFTNTSVNLGADSSTGWVNNNNSPYINWIFSRAPGFMDVCCYTGTGSGAVQNVTHNLTVVPEMMIVKCRSASGDSWMVYHSAIGNTKYLQLNSTAATGTFALWNNTTPTATQFTVGNDSSVNVSGGTFVNYLFASCPGVSKVGSYTGTGASDQVINCGFTGGARFVMIKRTDGTSNWRVWDTARGITSGNDPSLDLNNTAAEQTGFNQVDPDSSGFKVKANDFWNTSGANFIFLAIA